MFRGLNGIQEPLRPANEEIMTQHPKPLNTGVSARRIPRSVYVLTGCVGVIGANSLGLGPIAPEVARTFGVDVATTMLATAAFGSGAALSSVFLAPRIDRLGAYRMLRLSMLVLPLALLASALSLWVTMLIVAQFVAGLASGVAFPAIYAGAAGLAPPGRESKTIGLVMSGWMFSLVAGVSLSAIVADLTHWRFVYGLVALLAAAMLALLWRLNLRDKVSKGATPSPLSALSLPGIKLLLFANGALMTSFYGLYAYLGDYFHSGLGQSISANGLISLAYSVGFGGGILAGGLVNRAGVDRVLPAALFFVTVVYLLFGLLSDALVAILCLLVALGFGNFYSVNLLIVRLTAIDPAKRGTIMGLQTTVTNLAVFAGASGFGVIYSAGGFVAVAYTGMVLALMAAIASKVRSRG